MPVPPDPAPPADCLTDDPNYPLWVLQQAMDPLLGLLNGAGLAVGDGLTERLARLVLLAALAGKVLIDRVNVEQATHMVLAVATAELLSRANTLQRAAPDVGEPDAGELALLEAFCQTGAWPTDRPADAVAAVKQQLRVWAAARLCTADALLVGLMLAVEGRLELACRLLDLDSRQARDVLARVWRRFELAALRVAEETLHRGGREVPDRYGMTNDEG